MSSDEKRPKRINIQVQIDDETAQGRYANLVMINHTETEFVLDYLYVQPQQPKAKVFSRIITSPRHAKLLLRALEENISRYEKRFGPIPEVSAATKKLFH